MKFFSPQPLPFDYDDWKQRPFADRTKMLCQVWALQGYGAPVGVYTFYLLKIALYVGLWLFFCSFSTTLGGAREIGSWWFQPEALLKAILWSMLFEGVGMASGSGPLTARYIPPIGGALYFLRPGTIKLPTIPNLPLLGGDKRTWFDVLLYAAHVGWLIRILVAPEITPQLLWPTVILLPILGLSDKTIFLAARAEHYLIATVCFLFPADALVGAKRVWWAVWFWAATSKLNHHFPSVICVMLSNSAAMRFKWIRQRLYKDYPYDLRSGTLGTLMAHTGTIVEYTFPILLVFGGGGPVTTIGLIVMLSFHIFITSHVPMGVPIEWNIMMVYGGFVLFGHYAELWLFDMNSILLAAAIFIMVVVVPVIGNLFPQWVSFLMSMRYYAGNWAFSVWLFKGDSEEKLDDNLVMTSATAKRQLGVLYDDVMTDSLISMVIAFRMMHLHGRLLQLLVPKAVDNIEEYTWRDGELVCGVVVGWNFGDAHLHDEQLLTAVQKRCNYAPGELRCIFVESQPFGRPHLDWRIVDAHDGLLESGRSSVKELLTLQPWPEMKEEILEAAV